MITSLPSVFSCFLLHSAYILCVILSASLARQKRQHRLPRPNMPQIDYHNLLALKRGC
ncbi:hypothetical protein EV356DRAFT_14876 [Viridothelium virens]|uniref:Uncharacterized protein n=1 Tax=Viridothelium virens TaxID=1048519 RepID=A0A6A6HHF5_VIRVR|nr:hypothetical protein EV356DRAFT_14876 [Viridothelium virens]